MRISFVRASSKLLINFASPKISPDRIRLWTYPSTLPQFRSNFSNKFSQFNNYCTNPSEDVQKRIAKIVKSNRIVLLIKGSLDEPQCGFSNAVCRVLEMHGVLEKAKHEPNLLTSVDILQDPEIRSGAKVYADWPTFPQVYFNGQFVGGCDILLDMHKSGKLTEELGRLGIDSALKINPDSDS